MKILSITTFFILLLINNNSYSMGKRIEVKQFRFEDYRTADKAKNVYMRKKKEEIEKKYNYNPGKKDNHLSTEDFWKMLREQNDITKEDSINIEKLRNEKKFKKDAMTELLKLHPIGSNVDSLIKTIEGAGAIYSPITNPKYKDRPEYQNYLSYAYKSPRIFGLYSYEYRIGIKVNKNNSVIKEIDILFKGIK